ncbi:zinc finger, C2H2 type [Dictyocaulus viviparus]|uniref:Zinc finger, C2H2 type n=1 Tax=Dictyocaulus viviparus TaxID=29172 RepID=A0A0D8XJ61_DICVI|nr:zinc finger, C2H2 type [Dictyocaulus viviparus]
MKVTILIPRKTNRLPIDQSAIELAVRTFSAASNPVIDVANHSHVPQNLSDFSQFKHDLFATFLVSSGKQIRDRCLTLSFPIDGGSTTCGHIIDIAIEQELQKNYRMGREISEKEEFKCKLCEKIYRGDQYLKNHYKRSHGSQKVVAGLYIVCPGCQRKFQNHLQLTKHWKIEHGQVEGDLASNLMLASIRTRQHLEKIERKVASKLDAESHGFESTEVVPVGDLLNTKFHSQDTNGNTEKSPCVVKTALSCKKKWHCEHENVAESNFTHLEQKTSKCSIRKKRNKASERLVVNAEPTATRCRRRGLAKSVEQKERRWQHSRMKMMRKNMCKKEGLNRTKEPLLLSVNGSAMNNGIQNGSSTLGNECNRVRFEGDSRFEGGSKVMSNKPIGYAVVAINSEEEQQKFGDLMMNSGYSDVKFFDLKSSFIKDLSSAVTKVRNACTNPFFDGISTVFQSRLKGSKCASVSHDDLESFVDTCVNGVGINLNSNAENDQHNSVCENQMLRYIHEVSLNLLYSILLTSYWSFLVICDS